MSSAAKKATSSVVSRQQEISYPLDYSFKGANLFSDFLRERPRKRDEKYLIENDIESEKGSTIIIEKTNTTAFRVNNNLLSEWDGFMDTLEALIVNPTVNLAWLDLSFNDLKTIDSAILQLPNLMMLYLHGNNIMDLEEVDKLSDLSKLITLSLHGNPMEAAKGYYQYVLSKIPQLKTLDFTGVSRADKDTATVWSTMVAPKGKSKKRKKPKDN